MIITLLTLLLVFGFGGFIYYQLQQRANRLGGTISKAKAYWLTYALFNYFGLSLYLLISLAPESIGYKGLLIFIILILLRTLIQLIMMFGLLNWRPPYGIFSNLLISIVMISYLAQEIYGNEFIEIQHFILPLFIVKLTGILLCDSYYALAFYKIVGYETTGNKAVWFANDKEVRFDFINRLTFRMNIIFTLSTAFFLTMAISAYG